MERSYIFLIVTILLLVGEAYFSLYLIKKSKEDDPNFALSPARSKYFGSLGLFLSALFVVLLIVAIASGGYDPQNQIETKHQAVTSVGNCFYKTNKKLNIGLFFCFLICYNSIKEVI